MYACIKSCDTLFEFLNDYSRRRGKSSGGREREEREKRKNGSCDEKVWDWNR
jgi:hypothetical protein